MYMAGRITPSFQEDARRMLVHGRAERTDGQRVNVQRQVASTGVQDGVNASISCPSR